MKLYRFEKNDATRLETIKNNSLFISSPRTFNDLYDCSLNSIFSFTRDNTSHKNIEAAVCALYESEDSFPYGERIFKLLKKFLENEVPNIDQPMAQKNKKRIIQQIYDQIRSETGICCFFSGAPIHPLMWAHYADNHTGFCIEYNVDAQIGDTPLYEVNYSTKSLQLSIDELLLCPHEAFTRLLTTKSAEWNYEKEFRLIYLNSVLVCKNGKSIQRPATITPSRLIFGDKFCHSMNETLKPKKN